MHRAALAGIYLLLAGCALQPLPPVDYHESLLDIKPAAKPVAKVPVKPVPKPPAKSSAFEGLRPVVVTGGPPGVNLALASAMESALSASSYTVAASPNAWAVTGLVTVDGEFVMIKWQVANPDGVRVGTVSQARATQVGTLSDHWDTKAHEAAKAAVSSVVTLLPKPSVQL
jgi:hypothetical protein